MARPYTATIYPTEVSEPEEFSLWHYVANSHSGRTVSYNGYVDKPNEKETMPAEAVPPEQPSRPKKSMFVTDITSSLAAAVCEAIEVEIIQPRKQGMESGTEPGTEADKIVELHFEKFSKWYKVLKHDDLVTYDKIMAAIDDDHKAILLEGTFIYSPPPRQLKLNKAERLAEFNRPLNIALASCAFKVVARMLDEGVDTAKYDCGKANILHVLVISTCERRDREDDYLKLLEMLFKYLPKDETRRLLLEENTDGYRPLELAARMGIFGLFREMLNFPGYLVERSFEAGLNTYSVYNLREYEGLSTRRRFLRSPLRLIAYAIPDGFNSLQKYGITRLPVVEEWYNLVFRRNFAILVLWWIIRLSFIYLTISVDFTILLRGQCDKANQTNTTTDPFVVRTCAKFEPTNGAAGVAQFVISWSIAIAIMDMAEFLFVMLDKERRRAYRGITSPFRDYAAWTAFYRICQFLQVILGCAAPLVGSVFPGAEAFKTLIMIKALSLPFVMMSILYIVEPLPSIGLFAIALQKMISGIIAFIIFIIPVVLVFATFFHDIMDESFGFTDMSASMYRLFLLEIGSYDFGTDPGGVIQLVHVTYYLMTGILLMNYLIAVMTAAADQSDADRDTQQFLRRMNIVLISQERYGQWFWRAWMKIRKEDSVRVYAEEED